MRVHWQKGCWLLVAAGLVTGCGDETTSSGSQGGGGQSTLVGGGGAGEGGSGAHGGDGGASGAHASTGFVGRTGPGGTVGFDPTRPLSVASAADCDYVVDGQSGNDDASGAPGAPWATLGKAQQDAVENSVVCIKPGPVLVGDHYEYLESLSPERDGVTFVRHPDHTLEEVVIGGAPVDCGESCYTAEYDVGPTVAIWGGVGIVIEGLTVTYSEANGFVSNGWAGAMRNGFIAVVDCEDCAIRSSRIVRTGPVVGAVSMYDGIIQRAAGDNESVLRGIYDEHGIGLGGASTRVVIENNQVLGVGYGIVVSNATRQVEVVRNTLGPTTWSPVVVGSDAGKVTEHMGLRIANNVLESSVGEDGVQFEDSGLPCVTPDGSGGCELKDVGIGGVVIENNIIRHNGENAVDFKGAFDVVLDSNLVYGTINSDDGPFTVYDIGCADYPSASCASYPYYYWCVDDWECQGETTTTGTRSDTKHVIMRYNTFYDNAGGLARLYEGYELYHNTFVRNALDVSAYTPLDKSAASHALESYGHDWSLKNSLSVDHPGGELNVVVQAGVALDFNLYWHAAGASFVVYPDQGGLSLGDWQAQWLELGQEQHSVELTSAADAAQLFRSVPFDSAAGFTPVGDHEAGGYDFSLGTQSAAIDAGGPLTTVVSVSGSEIEVADARYFDDGFGTGRERRVALWDGAGAYHEYALASVSYDANLLTVAGSATDAAPGMFVNLPFGGAAPDIGAYESIP